MNHEMTWFTFEGNERMEVVGYLGLSGEGWGLRGGGVRGTAALGATEAAGTKPWAICFYTPRTRRGQGERWGSHGRMLTHTHRGCYDDAWGGFRCVTQHEITSTMTQNKETDVKRVESRITEWSRIRDTEVFKQPVALDTLCPVCSSHRTMAAFPSKPFILLAVLMLVNNMNTISVASLWGYKALSMLNNFC